MQLSDYDYECQLWLHCIVLMEATVVEIYIDDTIYLSLLSCRTLFVKMLTKHESSHVKIYGYG